MAKKKKISRKKLLKEPDEFITVSSKMLSFIVEHKIQLSWALCIFFAVIIMFIGFQYFITVADNKAFSRLDQLMIAYGQKVAEKGSAEAYLDMDQDFKSLLEKYGRRKGGKFARLIYGDICFNAGEYDRAIRLYQQSLKDFRHIYPYESLIMKSLAYSYIEKKDFSAAVTYFEKILSEPDPLMKDEVLFALARTYITMGQREKGTDLYRQLIADYPDSMFIQVAMDKVKDSGL